MENDKLDEMAYVILAGVFALTNMGQPLPTQSSIENAIKDYRNPRINWTIESSAIHFCGHLYESDEHEEIFLNEAKGWYKELKRHSDAKKYWNSTITLYENALKNVS
jgi:hypothetical protein